MTALGLLVGAALGLAGALLHRSTGAVVPGFDDQVLGLLLGGTGVLVVLVTALAAWADRADEDDPVLAERLLH